MWDDYHRMVLQLRRSNELWINYFALLWLHYYYHIFYILQLTVSNRLYVILFFWFQGTKINFVIHFQFYCIPYRVKIKEQNNFSNLVKIGVFNTEEFVRSKVGFWTFERRINEPQIKLNQSSTYYAMASIRLLAVGIRY